MNLINETLAKHTETFECLDLAADSDRNKRKDLEVAARDLRGTPHRVMRDA